MWDLNSLVAIDIHTHAHTPPEAADPEELAQRAAMKAYFGNNGEELPTPAIALLSVPRAMALLPWPIPASA